MNYSSLTSIDYNQYLLLYFINLILHKYNNVCLCESNDMKWVNGTFYEY